MSPLVLMFAFKDGEREPNTEYEQTTAGCPLLLYVTRPDGSNRMDIRSLMFLPSRIEASVRGLSSRLHHSFMIL